MIKTSASLFGIFEISSTTSIHTAQQNFCKLFINLFSYKPFALHMQLHLTFSSNFEKLLTEAAASKSK